MPEVPKNLFMNHKYIHTHALLHIYTEIRAVSTQMYLIQRQRKKVMIKTIS